MKSTLNIGTEYEKKAELYLIESGYRILAKNVRYPWGEIDLIAMDEAVQELVFVEVRSRKTGSMLRAEETLGNSKMKRLRRVIETVLNSPEFIRTESTPKGARIDLIAFEGSTMSHWRNFV
jgi:Holliday junction resolvase-like predicted endonuclease